MKTFFIDLGTGRWPVKTLKGAALAWIVGEVLSFAIAVKLLGLGLTLLVMFGTSVLGMAMLRRIGLGAVEQARRSMFGAGRNAEFVDGTLGALGALLLILPGFVSDAVGLVLVTPSLRQALAARLLGAPTPAEAAAPRRRAPPDVIDLGPEDWRVVEKPRRV